MAAKFSLPSLTCSAHSETKLQDHRTLWKTLVSHVLRHYRTSCTGVNFSWLNSLQWGYKPCEGEWGRLVSCCHVSWAWAMAVIFFLNQNPYLQWFLLCCSLWNIWLHPINIFSGFQLLRNNFSSDLYIACTQWTRKYIWINTHNICVFLYHFRVPRCCARPGSDYYQVDLNQNGCICPNTALKGNGFKNTLVPHKIMTSGALHKTRLCCRG